MAQTGDDYLYCIGIKMVNPDRVFSEVSGCSDHIRTLPYSKQKLRQQVLHMYISKSLNVDK